MMPNEKHMTELELSKSDAFVICVVMLLNRFPWSKTLRCQGYVRMMCLNNSQGLAFEEE